MADYSEYPDDLAGLQDNLDGELNDSFSQVESGEVDPFAWFLQTASLIIGGIFTAYLLGRGLSSQIDLEENEKTYIENWAALQLGYLRRFSGQIQNYLDAKEDLADEMAERAPWLGWRSRARSYASAAVAPYWKAKTAFLPLPAMPGDGTSQCGQHCKCNWVIDTLNEDDGDYDAYWVYGEAEHCQTCVERAESWNPLKIRGWELVLPEYQKSPGRFGKKEIESLIDAIITQKGGPGSGNHGHAGRPGLVGGSAPSKGAVAAKPKEPGKSLDGKSVRFTPSWW